MFKSKLKGLVYDFGELGWFVVAEGWNLTLSGIL